MKKLHTDSEKAASQISKPFAMISLDGSDVRMTGEDAIYVYSIRKQ